MFKKPTTLTEFLQWTKSILEEESFVQVSLGKPSLRNPKTPNTTSNVLKRAVLRPVVVKEGERILLVMTEARRDLTQTLTFENAASYIETNLGTSFLSAAVKTTERDVFLEITKSGGVQIGTSKPSITAAPSREHNREKQFTLSPKLPWLRDLGITNSSGELKNEMRDKFIQIERFANIIRPELEKLSPDIRRISAIDVGSGKSYLTFALYQMIQKTFPEAEVQVRGIEKRNDLVSLSNDVARRNEIAGLRFVYGLADEMKKEPLDIAVALHACDTATDDAINLAIQGRAKIICVAPCCHKYVRKKMNPTGVLEVLTRHGIHAERFGESLTDALRALYLEAHGYETKVVEFIDKSHTAKNTMILGFYSGKTDISAAKAQTIEAMQAAGLSDFYLDTLKVKKPGEVPTTGMDPRPIS